MLNKLVLNALVFGWLVLAAGPALAGDYPVITGDRAWDAFAETKKRWMLQLYDLILDHRPDLKEAADLALNWRLKELDYDNKRFTYLLRFHSDLIVRDMGLGAFAYLDWYSSYTDDLNKLDPTFWQLEKNVLNLQEANTQSSAGRELEKFIGELSKMEEHKTKFDQFYSEMAKIQRMLSQTINSDSYQ